MTTDLRATGDRFTGRWVEVKGYVLRVPLESGTFTQQMNGIVPIIPESILHVLKPLRSSKASSCGAARAAVRPGRLHRREHAPARVDRRDVVLRRASKSRRRPTSSKFMVKLSNGMIEPTTANMRKAVNHLQLGTAAQQVGQKPACILHNILDMRS